MLKREHISNLNDNQLNQLKGGTVVTSVWACLGLSICYICETADSCGCSGTCTPASINCSNNCTAPSLIEKVCSKVSCDFVECEEIQDK